MLLYPLSASEIGQLVDGKPKRGSDASMVNPAFVDVDSQGCLFTDIHETADTSVR